MQPRAAAASVVLGIALVGAGFALDRLVILDADVMLSLMLALVPAGAFLFLEGLMSLWRAARIRQVEKR